MLELLRLLPRQSVAGPIVIGVVAFLWQVGFFTTTVFMECPEIPMDAVPEVAKLAKRQCVRSVYGDVARLLPMVIVYAIGIGMVSQALAVFVRRFPSSWRGIPRWVRGNWLPLMLTTGCVAVMVVAFATPVSIPVGVAFGAAGYLVGIFVGPWTEWLRKMLSSSTGSDSDDADR